MRVRLHPMLIFLVRFTASFLVAFMAIYHLIIPAITIHGGYSEITGVLNELLLGVTLIAMEIFFFITAHTLFSMAYTVLNFAYWWLIPAADFIDFEGKTIVELPFITVLSWGILALVFIVAILTLINGIAVLVKNSGEIKKNPALKRNKIHWGRVTRPQAIALAIVLACATLPGVVLTFGLYRPTITIEPKDYDVTFKFWAHDPDISLYSDAILDELDEHAVTLDMCGPVTGLPTNASIEFCKQWEARCPNVTYRFVRTGLNIRQIIADTKIVLQRMVEYENNGTLSNWEGVTYDIENPTYETLNGFNSTEECIAAWEDLFAFRDQLQSSRLSGKHIYMESIHSDKQIHDFWDGDADLQKVDGYVSVSPTHGWSQYAPMLYRCGYSDWMMPPYGSVEVDPERIENGPAEPFATSYDFYRALYRTVNAFPIEKRGVYMGITNCSCYGRDLPQDPNTVTWFLPEENGTATGFGNLVRDVLIAKHFNIEEITFFLLKTASDDGIYIMGGTLVHSRRSLCNVCRCPEAARGR